MEFFGVPVRSFNMELTNRCTLACSECARTGNPWVSKNLSDLSPELVKEIFPLSKRHDFQGLRINLCGAYGDCIYHRQFHEVIRHLKAVGIKLMLETNGSHRKLPWWEETCDILGSEDTITFSVDGLEDTNHIYRVNARWADIHQAMAYCAPRIPVTWKFIVFSHNEHQVDDARGVAAELGVRDIIFKKSARFRVGDPLAPSNESYIGVVARNRRRIKALQNAEVSEEEFDRAVSIKPKCVAGKDLAITARGYLFPCTSCETADPDTWFYHHRHHFDLRLHSIHDILGSPMWGELQGRWQRASRAPSACLHYCGVHRDSESSYETESRPGRPNKPEDAVIVKVA